MHELNLFCTLTISLCVRSPARYAVQFLESRMDGARAEIVGASELLLCFRCVRTPNSVHCSVFSICWQHRAPHVARMDRNNFGVVSVENLFDLIIMSAPEKAKHQQWVRVTIRNSRFGYMNALDVRYEMHYEQKHSTFQSNSGRAERR